MLNNDDIWQLTHKLDLRWNYGASRPYEHARDEIISLLQQLVAGGHVQALPIIARYLLVEDGAIRQVARTATSQLMALMPGTQLLRIDEYFSNIHAQSISNDWWHLAPKRVAEVAGKPDDPDYISVLGILIFHRNGYVRHQAMRMLAENNTGAELPYLLIRQNDWVNEIARDATLAVKTRISHHNPTEWIESLPLILHLEELGRRDHSEIIRTAIEHLFSESFETLLRQLIQSPQRIVSRRILQHAVTQKKDLARRLICFAASSSDVTIRLAACRALASQLDDPKALETVAYMRADKFPPIRRTALEIFAQTHRDQAEASWKRALLDRNRSVREDARFYLKKSDFVSFAEFYRDSLADFPKSPAAALGLSETGDESDIPFFQAQLRSPLPAFRRAAVLGLHRLHKREAFAAVISLLQDEHASVVREVRQCLGDGFFRANPELLCELAVHGKSPLARRQAIRDLTASGKWRSWPWLLRIIRQADPLTAKLAEGELQDWLKPPRTNRVFLRPTPAEKEAIVTALKAAKPRISPELAMLLEKELIRFG